MENLNCKFLFFYQLDIDDYFNSINYPNSFNLKPADDYLISAGFLFRLHLINGEGVVPMWIE